MERKVRVMKLFAKTSVIVFVVTVAVLVIGLLGLAVGSIWGVAGTFDTWPVWALTFWRAVLTIFVVDLIPFGLSVIYLQDDHQ
jgi:hypothetical protein